MTNADISYAQLYNAGLDLLARREHSRLELSRKLKQRFGDCQQLEQVMNDLQANNLLSNQRFAESLARSRAGRGFGPARLRAELAAKGVSEGVVEAALGAEPTDWIASARAVLKKRFGDSRSLDLTAKAKRYRYLAQRGFSGEQIRRALEDVEDEGGE